MLVAEQNLPGMHQFKFHGLRFLNLYHQFAVINLSRAVADVSAGITICRIWETDPQSGVGFDPYLVAFTAKQLHTFGCQANPVFVVFDFPGYTDAHDMLGLD